MLVDVESTTDVHTHTIGWGEYGTVGVKSAPHYLSNGSPPERDKFILKVDLKIQIKGTLWSNIFLHDIPFLI